MTLQPIKELFWISWKLVAELFFQVAWVFQDLDTNAPGGTSHPDIRWAMKNGWVMSTSANYQTSDDIWHQIGQFVESGFAFVKSHKQQSTTRFWGLRNRIKFPGRIGSSNSQENHSNYTSKSDQWLVHGLFHLLINGVYWGPKTLFFAGGWSDILCPVGVW